jgi:hypothetical protein
MEFVHRPEFQRLRLDLSKGPNTVGVLPPDLRTETDSVSEALCFLVFRILKDGLSPEANNYKDSM